MGKEWTLQDARETYLVDKWGKPYFDINARGEVEFAPPGAPGRIVLKDLVDTLGAQGVGAPILVRFNDILKSRIEHINGCFTRSIEAYGYTGSYRGVMPIKVNQQRHVVEQMVACGAPFGLGLEAGSKPELLVAIAMLDSDDALLICNGYKDVEYIETALYAHWLGVRSIIVLDRFAELELIIAASVRTGIRPHIGVRAKLSSRGAGRWKDSTGDRSKFGLSPREIMAVIARLEEADMLDCLELLHFHIGSQITAISSLKEALREAMHLYCHIRDLGAENLHMVDCGGGLAVDYDGSQTNFHSSKNYSTQEYANDVVSTLQSICDSRGHAHPLIITESGRALLAQHSVLLFNVLGMHEFYDGTTDEAALQVNDGDHELLRRMYESYQCVNKRNFQEAYNDIIGQKEESATLFSLGVIDLRTRARADEFFWATCRRIQKVIQSVDYVPDDLKRLCRDLSDTFFCNFSVFQSLPDSWAVGHLFPIMPIHRLREEPQRDGILVDLTCDSDGKIDKFIDLRDVRETLRLHAPNHEPYYLGAFLVGAYQEILGDLHNLFGDTHAVHVSLNADGSYTLDHLIEGDTVTEVLRYVAYEQDELLRRVHDKAQVAVARGCIDAAHLAPFLERYAEGLAGYTYLEDMA